MKALSVISTTHHDVTDDLMSRSNHTWVEVFSGVWKGPKNQQKNYKKSSPEKSL